MYMLQAQNKRQKEELSHSKSKFQVLLVTSAKTKKRKCQISKTIKRTHVKINMVKSLLKFLKYNQQIMQQPCNQIPYFFSWL